ALLRQATGHSTVTLGIPVAGRDGTDVEHVIGSFANMLVLRVDLTGDETVHELVRRTHLEIRDAHAHQDAPYAQVVEALSPPRDLSRNPLFQVMVSIAEPAEQPRSAGGLRFAFEQVDSGLTDFDTFLTLVRQDGGLCGGYGYNSDLYL